MGEGYVSQLDHDIILELCHKYSRGTSKIGKRPIDILTRNGKTVGSGITREEIENMLYDFNNDILSFELLVGYTANEKEERRDRTRFWDFFPKVKNKEPMERMFFGSNQGL